MRHPKFQTLRDLFIYSTEKYPNNAAFSFVDGPVETYNHLRNKTGDISTLLTDAGICSGDKVALYSQNMPNWPAAYFAATAFGRVIVPILPDFSGAEVDNIIKHSESKALIVSTRLAEKISEEVFKSMNIVINLDTLEVIHKNYKGDTVEVIEPKTEDLATIIYTSGTTGNSKGVMLTHSNLCRHLDSASTMRPGYEWDVWLSVLPLSHTLESSLSMILPMATGSSVYYIEKMPTPTILMNAFKKVRPTTMLVVPLIIEKIFKAGIAPNFQKSALVKRIYSTTIGRKLLHRVAGKKLYKKLGGRVRFFGIGGAKLDATVDRFLFESGIPYAIGYGLTETAPLLAGAIGKNRRIGSTGLIVTGMDVKINNPDPKTGIGEIVAKGANVMTGYYKNPEATSDAFTEDGWFRTKDLGCFDKDNLLYIKGRLSNMILGPSGENIYPEHIEDVLNSHEFVAESIVTEDKGRLVALVHFDESKLQEIYDERDKTVETYQQKIDRLKKLYEQKMEMLQDSLYSKKDELMEIVNQKMDNTMKFYNEKKDEAQKLYNEQIEKLKREVHSYVNDRVNKSSKISSVEYHPEQFEKTATQKIKRFKYTKKESPNENSSKSESSSNDNTTAEK